MNEAIVKMASFFFPSLEFFSTIRKVLAGRHGLNWRDINVNISAQMQLCSLIKITLVLVTQSGVLTGIIDVENIAELVMISQAKAKKTKYSTIKTAWVINRSTEDALKPSFFDCQQIGVTSCFLQETN